MWIKMWIKQIESVEWNEVWKIDIKNVFDAGYWAVCLLDWGWYGKITSLRYVGEL